MKVGKRVKIWHIGLSNIGECFIGNDCVIHSHVWIGDKVKIGDRCKIQAFSFLPTGVRLGNDVFVGPHVSFTNDRHPPSGEWLPTIVGDNVSIGAGAVILPGVSLGNGARVGAGAVVARDVEPGQLVVGPRAEPLDVT